MNPHQYVIIHGDEKHTLKQCSRCALVAHEDGPKARTRHWRMGEMLRRPDQGCPSSPPDEEVA